MDYCLPDTRNQDECPRTVELLTQENQAENKQKSIELFFQHKLSKTHLPRIVGLLTTEETDCQRSDCCDVEEDCLALNSQPNQQGLLDCLDFVQGEYPIYLPYNSMLSPRLTGEAHQQTLHGGVGLTIPRLRQLVRKV